MSEAKEVTGLADLARALSQGANYTCAPFTRSNRDVFLLAFLESARLSGQSVCLVLAQNRKELFEYVAKINRLMQNPGGQMYQVVGFPQHSFWGRNASTPPRSEELMRTSCLGHLSLNKPGQLTVVVSTVAGLCQQTLAAKVLQQSNLFLQKGEEVDPIEFADRLSSIGYQKALNVHDPGTYAVRGGILDIFPAQLKSPVRIEFFGDHVASIHRVDPLTERSAEECESLAICRAVEVETELKVWQQATQRVHEHLTQNDVMAEERHAMLDSLGQRLPCAHFTMFAPLFRSENQPFLSYFPSNVPCFCLDSHTSLWKGFQTYLEECLVGFEDDLSLKRPSFDPAEHLQIPPSSQEFFSQVKSVVFFDETSEPGALVWNHLELAGFFDLNCGISAQLDPQNVAACLTQIRSQLDQGESVVVVMSDQTEADTVQNVLLQDGFSPSDLISLDHNRRDSLLCPDSPSLQLYYGFLSTPFYDASAQIWWLPAKRLLENARHKVRRKQAKYKLQESLDSLADLKHGDYVVHMEHGIGVYQGMTSLDVGNMKNDFVKIVYQANDLLYVPVNELNCLYRYFSSSVTAGASQGGENLKVDKLRSSGWGTRKARTQKAIKDIAVELIGILAERRSSKGVKYPAPTEEYHDFCDNFPYQETPDQLAALEDIELDLCSSRPLDRLLIGDVGFGKTEVALRVAYRAVLEGFQVLVLVPTTVLCLQHSATFRKRLHALGVEVAGVSGRNTRSQQSVVLKRLREGRLDILVGTHRLLSSDIQAHKLGLIIIDEEHKFGVMHKEKIKKLRMGADVLTLSATPIPRTLHMSMIGLRDISVLTTPPVGRRPVFTQISPNDDEMIAQALHYELSREGQAFVLHNRVEDIHSVAERIRRIVPGSSVAIVHGQQPKAEMESVLIDFMNHRYSVLVATTIIESGLDIPSVNTLIVMHAERFGLAQLHQIRGRVGRASIQAYCYFVTEVNRHSSPEAYERLMVLIDHQELGSGFQISSRDLEMRGAGDLIGGKQAGHMESIGVELYTKLLDQEIFRLSGGGTKSVVEVSIKLPVSARINQGYMPRESERLNTYKKLVNASDHEEVSSISNWMKDKFGPHPRAVYELIWLTHIRVSLVCLGVAELSLGEGFFTLEVSQQHVEQSLPLSKFSQKSPDVCFKAGEYTYAVKGALKDREIEVFARMLIRIETVDL